MCACASKRTYTFVVVLFTGVIDTPILVLGNCSMFYNTVNGLRGYACQFVCLFYIRVFSKYALVYGTCHSKDSVKHLNERARFCSYGTPARTCQTPVAKVHTPVFFVLANKRLINARRCESFCITINRLLLPFECLCVRLAVSFQSVHCP